MSKALKAKLSDETVISPAECMRLHLKAHRPKLTENRFWTKEEDELLGETVGRLGTRNW